ncbi:lysophospholipid acyltransferase family protein [Candidatus Xianfuyuplasma coldseepsis]|uniref:1-acyl-sn-glycerol-3-phosphate acyltransferase n=1 Tax=Candidatus Xianfuyuplasma coldseepsis TaxID=2782163 RepID=A0A7L7KUI0_9MOLU|nr:lysophospholipid acyltransferase family protein [Xianfuyuplasma coldseepsis]QMS85654.1 1-acyl-sn-glycerol-3-phosphate acyltransferase [Xianfuyuplasma coldseepsis]
MKRSVADIFSDIALFFIRPIVYVLMRREIKIIHEGPVIKQSHKPFILISNHFNTWDAFVVSRHMKKNIRFVATEIAFLDFSKKIGMKHLARAIMKRVGKHEYKATKRIFNALKQGYAIGLFPEGDNTFYGETLDIYTSTGKLLKRTGVDVILIKQQGGYISQPRWADYFSTRGILHTKTSTLFTVDELKQLSVADINKRVKAAIYNNDYEWQKEQMIDFRRKKRAEGIERLVYYCNNCGGILTVHGEGHDIVCDDCGTIGTINEYEFIEGNTFDNLVDYNHFQYQHIDKVIASEFSFPVTFNIVNTAKLKNKSYGTYTVYYKDQTITVSNGMDTHVFELEYIKYPVNTMRHSFSFDYEGVTYNFTDIRHQFVLYEMCRYLNGSYKE